MVTKLRIPSFIATYGMLWVAQGATYYYMSGQSVYGFPAGFRALGSGYSARHSDSDLPDGRVPG